VVFKGRPTLSKRSETTGAQGLSHHCHQRQKGCNRPCEIEGEVCIGLVPVAICSESSDIMLCAFVQWFNNLATSIDRITMTLKEIIRRKYLRLT
jgi:hypothetical protein